MKKLGFFILLVLLGTGLWAGNGHAQTDTELQDAIDDGPAAVRNFYQTHGNDASGLAGLDPSLIEQSVMMSGGIENLQSQMSINELGNFLEELGEVGNQDSAVTAAGLLTELSNFDSALGEALTNGLGVNFMEDLNNQVSGLANAMDEVLGPLFNLSNGLGDILSGFNGLFGGGSGGSGGAMASVLGGVSPGSLLGSAATGGGSSTALPSATPMSPTCDPDILIAMETRAWLEAQREITQNQNLIAKPDSVLEYTCFDSFLDVLAQQAETMFSENTDAWSGSIPISDTDMDNALDSLVGTAANAYVTANFAHSFIGGRGSDDYVPDTISGAAYTCDVMNKVWMNAKCMNFATRPEDGFLTFQQHAATDPRTLPAACSPEARWAPYIEATFESPNWRAPFTTDVETAYTTASEYAEPGQCDNNRSIRTGLTIFDEGNEIDDTVCLNPGCFFDGTGCVAY